MDDLLFFCQAPSEGVTFESMWAHTLETSRQVAAEGTLATRLGSSTFIDVNTTRKTVALTGETVSTDANWLACMVELAFRMCAAKDVFTGMSALISEVG